MKPDSECEICGHPVEGHQNVLQFVEGWRPVKGPSKAIHDPRYHDRFLHAACLIPPKREIRGQLNFDGVEAT